MGDGFHLWKIWKLLCRCPHCLWRLRGVSWRRYSWKDKLTKNLGIRLADLVCEFYQFYHQICGFSRFSLNPRDSASWIKFSGLTQTVSLCVWLFGPRWLPGFKNSNEQMGIKHDKNQQKKQQDPGMEVPGTKIPCESLQWREEYLNTLCAGPRIEDLPK